MPRAALGFSLDSSSKDELFRQLVDSITDYAIFVLSPDGHVLTWNLGAELLMGYSKLEILGTHASKFYLPEEIQSGQPAQELAIAEKEGRFAGEGWRVRKGGATFCASAVITPLRDSTGELCGFAKVVQDTTQRREAEKRISNLNQELQRLSARVLHVQDEERRRIARELHDDLGQQLGMLKITLSKRQNGEAIELTDSALNYVRNLSYLLHPPLLDETGLRQALNWFVDGLTLRSGILIEVKIQPDEFPRLGMEVETAIFRIVQESLSNVFRHAEAKKASVELEKQNDRIVVRIRDYGKGFPADVITPNGNKTVGVGIAGMRERIRQFGGSLKVSRCEPGTMVEASVPLTVGAG
jgi:PAS domain S-box-containing protein